MISRKFSHSTIVVKNKLFVIAVARERFTKSSKKFVLLLPLHKIQIWSIFIQTYFIRVFTSCESVYQNFFKLILMLKVKKNNTIHDPNTKPIKTSSF